MQVNRGFWSVAGCFLAIFTSLQSSVSEPRRASVSGDIEQLFLVATSQGASSLSGDQGTSVRLSGYESAVGRFTIHLEREKFYHGITGARYFQGAVRGRRATESRGIAVAVTNTKRNGTPTLQVFVEPKFSRRRKSFRLIDLTFESTSEGFKVTSVRRLSSRRPMGCGIDGVSSASSSGGHPPHDGPARTSSVREVELRLDGDVEFFSAIPDAVANMGTMVTIADAFYRRDLGIGLIASITGTAQSYNAAIEYDENFELDYFKAIRNAVPDFTGDAFFVFTGKTPPSQSLKNLAGVANGIGVVCNDKPHSLGIVLTRFDTGSLSSFTAATLAHELGHTLAMTHDDASNPAIGYIMNSGTNSNLSNYVDEFSSQSKAEVAAHIETFGSCLAVGADLPQAPPSPPPSENPDPNTPDPTAPDPTFDPLLYITKGKIGKKAVLYGYAYDGETPIAGVSVRVVLKGTRTNKVVYSGVTNEFGAVTFYPKKLGKYFVTSEGYGDSRAVNVKQLKFGR